MKTRHILLLALSLAATAAQAQMNIKISTGQTFRKDTIDHKVLTVQYGLNALTDLSKPDARMQETLRLDIGRQASRFYSYRTSGGRRRASTATRPSWPTPYWPPTWPTALPPS